jgi:hypothetical protein
MERVFVQRKNSKALEQPPLECVLGAYATRNHAVQLCWPPYKDKAPLSLFLKHSFLNEPVTAMDASVTIRCSLAPLYLRGDQGRSH